ATKSHRASSRASVASRASRRRRSSRPPRRRWAARRRRSGARRRWRAGARRRRTGVPGLDDDLSERAAKWAEETAVAQGLPARVEDIEVLRNVCELLGICESDAPDRMQA